MLFLSGPSLVLALFAGEGILRIVAAPQPGYIRIFRVPDPQLGWRLTPNVTFLYRIAEEDVTVQYNSTGWRDREHPKPLTEDTDRILVLGDSFMEAYSVDLEDTFHSRLEQLFADEQYRVETINLGVAGYGTLQEYLAYEHHGRHFSPKLVLLAVFIANDVNNNSLELERWIHTGQDQLVARPYLEPTVDWAIAQVDFARAQLLYEQRMRREGLTTWWPGHRSLLARESARAVMMVEGKVARAMSRFLDRPPHGDARGVADRATEQRTEKASPYSLHDVHACEEKPAFTRAWDITARILARLRDAVRRDGAELVVFTVPAVEEVDDGVMERMQAEATATNHRLCLRQAPGYARLAEMVALLGIPYLDLLPDFRSVAKGQGRGLFRMSDEHWGPAGHTLAASRVHRFLLDGGFVTRVHGMTSDP